eukprot:4957959-Amphidinium_carterae.1
MADKNPHTGETKFQVVYAVWAGFSGLSVWSAFLDLDLEVVTRRAAQVYYLRCTWTTLALQTRPWAPGNSWFMKSLRFLVPPLLHTSISLWLIPNFGSHSTGERQGFPHPGSSIQVVRHFVVRSACHVRQWQCRQSCCSAAAGPLSLKFKAEAICGQGSLEVEPHIEAMFHLL